MRDSDEEIVCEDTYHAGLRVDLSRWRALQFVGIQPCGETSPGEVLELRNCTCGSTLARRIRRKP